MTENILKLWTKISSLGLYFRGFVVGKCRNVADLKNGRLISSRESYNIGDESGSVSFLNIRGPT